MIHRNRTLRLVWLISAIMIITGCESWGPHFAATLEDSDDITLPSSRVDDVTVQEKEEKLAEEIEHRLETGEADSGVTESWTHTGSGQFVNQAKPVKVERTKITEGNITLNFENTDIREVVKVILGDTLKKNYILDPAVRGGVTMQTGAPISRGDLLPTLETLLRMNGASLVIIDGQYRVVPIAKAHKGMATPQLADSGLPLPYGYSVLIRPLQNIAAEEMNEILKPLVLESSVIRVDEKRNLLLLAGNGRELAHILDVINTFDVNWIKGLSVGFFSLKNSNVEDIKKDLDAILGGDAGKALGGLVRITPVESANGFLVVTPRAPYLEEIGSWIERLDNMAKSTGGGERMFVYRVRNGTAADLAELLNQLFDGKSSTKKTTSTASVAPGLKKTTVTSVEKTSTEQKSSESKGAGRGAIAKEISSASGSLEGDIRVVADEAHNTLLIMALPRDYEKIRAALEELDIVPLQVHIEATIVEVKLVDSLEYGIQWFFKGGAGSYDSTGGVGSNAGLPITGIGGIGDLFPGFNWSLVGGSGDVRAVLNAFAEDSLINVLSAPSVLVLDNYEASIQVGDEVPTLTGRQSTEGGQPIESYQYRETGIILHVKPRVNPGGLVTMEISQEVSQVPDADVGTDQPTIQTRKIESTVAVQSGQTVVLGGLIRDQRTDGQGGVPGLYKVPVVGALFGDTSKRAERTELVVVLTPSVITSAQDAQALTDDFRIKMQGLKDEFLKEAGVIKALEIEESSQKQ